jgi:hypothetical protein
MRFHLFSTIAATAALLAACATVPVMAPRELTATVSPRGDSEARASVRAVTGATTTVVAINFAGGVAGGTHPWHVHSGSCATGGPIVGEAGRYPPLRPGTGGTAAATTTINVVLAPGQNYHVNVHRSPEQLDQVIACGDLR